MVSAKQNAQGGKEKRGSGRGSLLALLKPYKLLLGLLLLFTLLSNGINLLIPKLIQAGIDGYQAAEPAMRHIVLAFLVTTALVFLFGYLQSLLQTYTSEKVARDLRNTLSDKVALQSYDFVEQTGPSKLLTHFTADTDAIKMFVAQAVTAMVSSFVMIIGASILLLSLNWRLGALVLLIIPLIFFAFFFIFRKVKPLFRKSHEAIDRLNKTISEAILGAALIRVLNAQFAEQQRFLEDSGTARNLGLTILRLFALLIPVITLTANLAILLVLVMGGDFVIEGRMSLGTLAAFNSYIAMLIFPILVIGFMSNVIARSSASFGRIQQLLHSEVSLKGGSLKRELEGAVELQHCSLRHGEKYTLKSISFSVAPGSRTAILGPTAAGKTQLLYLMTGLATPESGSVLYDGIELDSYDRSALLGQIGLVFQDSILFNASIRDNIAFSAGVTESDLHRAIQTAALGPFIDGLPEGLETNVSERGNRLSGGQKQRIMLARALAHRPKVLLLDDFTARVDRQTEKQIRENLEKNYPGITLISITQNIEPVKDYDQIILLMEGELIARGRHAELLASCPEYMQIYASQHSTSHYEA